MLYHLYELSHAAMSPARAAANSTRLLLRNPLNPLSYTNLGRNAAAAAELMERTTRRYKKLGFNIKSTTVRGKPVEISEESVWRKPFCDLLHFKKNLPEGAPSEPHLLIVAPLSGHYATLLAGTVEAMLPFADVYITDWHDARHIPLREGPFTLDDYIDYVMEMIEIFQGDVHVMAVCQPGRSGDVGGGAHGSAQPSFPSEERHPEGKPNRYAAEPDRGQQARRGKRHQLVPADGHHFRALAEPRAWPPRLPRFPSADRLHGDEPRPPYECAQGSVREPG